MKLLQLESHINEDVSSIHEQSFAEEIYLQMKQKDSVLEKAKQSILSIQTENQSLQRQHIEQQEALFQLKQDRDNLAEKIKGLEDKNQNQFQEIVGYKNQIQALTNNEDKLTLDLKQKEFLIADLQKRFCNMEQSEKNFEGQFKSHLQAVDLGYQEQITKLRQSFSEQLDKVYDDKQQELQKMRQKILLTEDSERQARIDLQNQQQEITSFKQRETQFNAQVGSLKIQMNEKVLLQQNFDKLQQENEGIKVKCTNIEEFNSNLKVQVLELGKQTQDKTDLIMRSKEKHEKLVLVIKQLQSESEKSQQDANAYKTQLDTKTQQIDSNIKQISQLERENKEISQSYNTIIAKNEVLDRSILQINSEFKILEQNHNELQGYYRNIKDEYEAVISTLQIAQKEVDQLQKMNYDFKQHNQQLQQEKEDDSDEVLSLQTRLNKYKGQLDEQINNASNLALQHSQIAQELTNQKLEKETYQKQFENSEQNFEKLYNEHNQIKQQFEQLNGEHGQLQIQFQLIKQELERAQHQLDNILNEKQQTEQFIENQQKEKYQVVQSLEQQYSEAVAFAKQLQKLLTEFYNEFNSKYTGYQPDFSMQASLFSVTSNLGPNKTQDVYRTIGDLKNKCFDCLKRLEDEKSQNQSNLQKSQALQLELDGANSQLQYLQKQLFDNQQNGQSQQQEHIELQTETMQLRNKVVEIESTLKQAMDQRQQLKQQKQDQLNKIDDINRKNRELKQSNENLQQKLGQEVRTIQEQFQGQVKGLYNRCIMIGQVEALKKEINDFYMKLAM
ncbi:hypothetical protein SS50377_23673 [Spironucleus salmonicida]|nr:hypothetical protein SS50377_23673 [Spironucleus salmonicida]